MSWTGLCRLLRAETLKVREMGYIQSATAFGAGHFSIIGRHILPNVLHIVLITVVLDFSGLVLVEAVLSYLSIGVDPSMRGFYGVWGDRDMGENARQNRVFWRCRFLKWVQPGERAGFLCEIPLRWSDVENCQMIFARRRPSSGLSCGGNLVLP